MNIPRSGDLWQRFDRTRDGYSLWWRSELLLEHHPHKEGWSGEFWTVLTTYILGDQVDGSPVLRCVPVREIHKMYEGDFNAKLMQRLP